ncbi:hypothetical protein GCM10009841_30750 [Microlunatus panaciterrae]
MPDPRGRTPRPDPVTVADSVPGLLRHRPRFQGGTEAIGLIELHRRIARGFRNLDNYRLLFLIGGRTDQPHLK